MKKINFKKSMLVKVLVVFVAVMGGLAVWLIDLDNTIHAEILTTEKPVSSEKEWTIQFNTKISMDSATKNIRVVNESTGKTHENIDVRYGEQEEQLIVSPNEPYKYGETFILEVMEGLESDRGKELKNTTSMRFEIETVKPIEYNSQVFSTGYAEIKDGNVYLKGEKGETEPYLLSEKDRPLINSRLSNLARALVEEGFFTGVRHYGVGTDESRATVQLAPTFRSWANGYTAFEFYLYEHQGFDATRSWFDDKLTQNAEVVLHLSGLAYDYEKMNKETYSVPKYEEKLKKSLQALYPKHYEEINDYIFQRYIEKMEYYGETHGEGETPTPQTKTFGNIKVDTAIGLGDLIVYFTKVGKEQ